MSKRFSDCVYSYVFVGVLEYVGHCSPKIGHDWDIVEGMQKVKEIAESRGYYIVWLEAEGCCIHPGDGLTCRVENAQEALVWPYPCGYFTCIGETNVPSVDVLFPKEGV